MYPIGLPSSVLLRGRLILNILCVVTCLVFRLSTALKKLSVFLLFDSETRPRNCKGKTRQYAKACNWRYVAVHAGQKPDMNRLAEVIIWVKVDVQ